MGASGLFQLRTTAALRSGCSVGPLPLAGGPPSSAAAASQPCRLLSVASISSRDRGAADDLPPGAAQCAGRRLWDVPYDTPLREFSPGGSCGPPWRMWPR